MVKLTLGSGVHELCRLEPQSLMGAVEEILQKPRMAQRVIHFLQGILLICIEQPRSQKCPCSSRCPALQTSGNASLGAQPGACPTPSHLTEAPGGGGAQHLQGFGL